MHDDFNEWNFLKMLCSQVMATFADHLLLRILMKRQQWLISTRVVGSPVKNGHGGKPAKSNRL